MPASSTENATTSLENLNGVVNQFPYDSENVYSLSHVGKGEFGVVHSVCCGVDVSSVGIIERSLNAANHGQRVRKHKQAREDLRKSRLVTGFGEARVVRAGIRTLGLDRRDAHCDRTISFDLVCFAERVGSQYSSTRLSTNSVKAGSTKS